MSVGIDCVADAQPHAPPAMSTSSRKSVFIAVPATRHRARRCLLEQGGGGLGPECRVSGRVGFGGHDGHNMLLVGPRREDITQLSSSEP